MNQPIAAPLAPLRPIPRATYRLQLHRDFGFRAATQALPYLAALGISHVYCSPYLRATPGSRHGYDVVDPTTINPDLGTAEDFNRFNRQLRALGLTQLLDIVPNHMGVESADNDWWQDVLRNGSNSAFAGYFDIDWSGATGLTPGRLLLPVLGASLEQAISQGQVKLRRDEVPHAFRIDYFERRLPVNARGTALIFAAAAERDLGQVGEPGEPGDQAPDAGLQACLEDPALVAAVAACQHYELAPWQDAARRINYRRFFDVSGLAALRIEDPVVFEASHRQVVELVRAGIVGGLRVDHPDGLRDPATYFSRLQAAVAAGDDGRLAQGPLYIVAEKILAEGEDLPADWPVSGTTGYDFANLACGLLLDGETAAAVDRAWRDFTGETVADFGEMAVAAKKEVLRLSFGSEMDSLSRKFLALLPKELQEPPDLAAIAAVLAETIACFPVYRTYPGPAATPAARSVVARACSEAARRLAQAADREPNRESALLAILQQILTGPTGDVETAQHAASPDWERAQWAVRFQQLSAPVMAKGVEDTALYRWTRLVSINDVGADPDVTGVSVEHFHEANARRRARWPHAMLATSTHDNKRGEYVRMRVNLISEDVEHWRGIAAAWRESAARLMHGAGMRRRPSAGDQYLLFQTFIGTWPVMDWRGPAVGHDGGCTPSAPLSGEQAQDYADRVKAYMTKACREAKLQTSWTEPDDEYESAIHGLVDLVLGDAALAARIARDVRPFAWYGALNSISLTALKLTVPGVPDIYQGANVLDDSLVDPDNRRPVDFAERRAVITELAQLGQESADRIRADLAAWLAAGDFSRLKLWTIHRLLGWRALHPQLFEAGAYVPVPVKGRLARHCVAFARRNERHGILVVATRLYRQLGFPGPWAAPAGEDADAASRSGETDAGGRIHSPGSGAGSPWQDEVLDLEAAGIRAVNLNDILSNPVNPTAVDGPDAGDPAPRWGPAPIADPAVAPAARSSATLPVSGVLGKLPIAVLSFDVDPDRR